MKVFTKLAGILLAILIAVSSPVFGAAAADANPLDGADHWAIPELLEGIEMGVIPPELQKDYTQPAARAGIARLIVNLLEYSAGEDIEAILDEKGKAIGGGAFTDTADADVLAAGALGIINGTGGGKFSPNGHVTRAQFAAIVSRTADVLGYKLVDYPKLPFNDVQSHWAKEELPFGVSAGVFIGTDTYKFSPDEYLTVQELGVAAARAALFFRPNWQGGTEAPPAPGKNVMVSTELELINAIEPDTCITLEAGKYDLSTVIEAGEDNPYINWKGDAYDYGEPSLWIMDVSGLTLQAAPGADVEIVTPYRYAKVMAFVDCNGVTLKDIAFGHSVTGEYVCDEGVAYFQRTDNISVSGCNFYGCGAIGMSFDDCQAADISDTVINDCSLRAVILRECAGISFTKCKLIDNGAYMPVIEAQGSSAVFTDCEISGNKGLRGAVVDAKNDGGVLFDRCKFIDNALVDEYWGDRVMEGGIIKLKDCEIERGNFRDYWSGNIFDLGGNEMD